MLIPALVILAFYITHGNSRETTNVPDEFEIEYVTWVHRGMSPKKLPTFGPALSSNGEYLQRLCDAARSYAALDPDPEEPLELCLEPGRPSYPNDNGFYPYWHILWCNALPQVWIRRAEDESFVMMMEYSAFVNAELSFDEKIAISDPEPCSDANEDNRMESYFNTTEALHLCWRAKNQIDSIRPKLSSSEVSGGNFVFEFDDDSKETHVALQCPSLPKIYIYFGDSKADIRVVHVRINYRRRQRKSATPKHFGLDDE